MADGRFRAEKGVAWVAAVVWRGRCFPESHLMEDKTRAFLFAPSTVPNRRARRRHIRRRFMTSKPRSKQNTIVTIYIAAIHCKLDSRCDATVFLSRLAHPFRARATSAGDDGDTLNKRITCV